MMTSLVAVGILQVSVLAAEPQQSKEPPSDFRAAYARSLANGTPLIVLLGADWCPACRVMKNDVMPKVAKAGGLKNVEFSYVDVDEERDLAGALVRGNSIPQLIRWTKTRDGWQRHLLVGAHQPEKVAAFIQKGPQEARLELSSWSGSAGRKAQ